MTIKSETKAVEKKQSKLEKFSGGKNDQGATGKF